MLKATDMRRKINSELKGKSEAEQIRVIEGYIQDWPPNVRGEYVEIRRHLVRRLEKLRTNSRVRASTGAPSNDPFVVAKSGHLTAALVGLPNAGKTYVFHRLGGDGATIAGYPFSTAVPAVHLAALDNLSIQVVDLPPIVEDTVSSLPYGTKLRRMVALADILCVVLDGSGDVEYQDLVLSDELGSMGVEPQDVASLVLVNRAAETPSFRLRPESSPLAASDGTLTGPPSFRLRPESSPPVASGGILAGPRVSLRSERDFDDLLAWIARAGGYLAAFAKPPGQSPDEADRLWVERGATVEDLAAAVHRDLARRLTGARVWSESVRQPGQTVSAEHLLSDGDVVELLAH